MLDVGARLSAAGEHQHGLDQHLAPVMGGSRSPVTGMAAESESPSPRRSAKLPRACRPTWATTPRPDPSTTAESALLRFTW